MPVVLGLTGNIASGKTTVGQMLLELGAVRYIDADEVVHHLYEPGQSIYAGVVAAFGDEILTPEGTIDRRHLGNIVFNDAEALRRLEAIVHPAVGAAIMADIQTAAPDAVLILDAVKLLEGGTGALCKSRWLVICAEEQQLRRLMSRNGFSEEEARARLRAQPPIEPKLPLVDEVINNSGTLEVTRAQVEAAWERFQQISPAES
ncbi:MAG TPA: dephospho-CoA kinase [Ktedonobacterales bacterium]|nr:dephospho-CoA kinase [Ktedonobacterales bacterium]